MLLSVNNDLHLETIQEKHAADLFRLVDSNRVYLREWMPWEKNQVSVADALEFISESESQFKNDGHFQAGIFFKNTLCGMIGLHQVNWLNKNTHMGYWLGEDYQGKGIMTHAARRLINHCIQEMLLHRIEIRCGVGNVKSQAVAERLGFIREGLLREVEWLNGNFIDHIVFSYIHQSSL